MRKAKLLPEGEPCVVFLPGGGGFFLACEDFGEKVRPFIPCLRFLIFFLSEVEISLCTLIPIFMPGSVHNGSAGIVSPLRIRWVKGVCVFRCNLPTALWAE